METLHYRPLVRGIHRWIPLTKGHKYGKPYLYVMTSSFVFAIWSLIQSSRVKCLIYCCNLSIICKETHREENVVTPLALFLVSRNIVGAYIYIYIHTHTHIYVYIYIYIYDYLSQIRHVLATVLILLNLLTGPYGLMQERRNSIANALGLRLSCSNPSIHRDWTMLWFIRVMSCRVCMPQKKITKSLWLVIS